jgi:hypothetical protein
LLKKVLPAATAALALILTGCSSPEKPDPCGPRSVLRENLRIAAEKNPVPDWNISMETRTESFWANVSDEVLQPWLDNQNIEFYIGQQQAELIFWAERTGGKEPGHFAEVVRFPVGDLRTGAPLPDVLAAAKRAFLAGQAESIGTWSDRPMRAPTGARDGYHEWNLPDAYRWYKDEGQTFACVSKTLIQISEDGPVRRIDLPMLQVGANKFVGFSGGRAVTLEHEAGLFGYGSEIFWYNIPGLK